MKWPVIHINTKQKKSEEKTIATRLSYDNKKIIQRLIINGFE